jgi:glycolate oxidase FAD binding subunit
LVAGLAGLIGEDRLTSASETEGWAVAGAPPEAVVAPEDADEVVELLRWAGAGGIGVVARGGGRHLGSRRPRPPFVILSTARLRGIDTYEPADLTLTARAGTTLAELNGALAEHAQWAPFDAPGGATRTLGGLVASGHAGPLAAGYGALRDHLLGATVVTGDGRTLRLGGRVVKNVAGFDVLRLMVGSQGTLAVVVSACVRVFPVPAVEWALVRRGAHVSDVVDAALRVATAPIVPAGAVIRTAGGAAGAELVVLLHGARDRVASERAIVETHVGARFEVAEGERARTLLEPDEVDLRPAALRLSVLPSRLGGLLAAVEAQVGPGASLSADVIAGALRVGMDAPAGGVVLETVTALRAAVGALGGTLAVERAGIDLARGASAPPVGVADLDRGLRRSFDPGGVLWPTAGSR